LQPRGWPEESRLAGQKGGKSSGPLTTAGGAAKHLPGRREALRIGSPDRTTSDRPCAASPCCGLGEHHFDHRQDIMPGHGELSAAIWVPCLPHRTPISSSPFRRLPIFRPADTIVRTRMALQSRPAVNSRRCSEQSEHTSKRNR
jgi:hypothetical protein